MTNDFMWPGAVEPDQIVKEQEQEFHAHEQVIILDDFLPKEDFNMIKSIMSDPGREHPFTWKFVDKVIDDHNLSCNQLDNYQFTHLLYHRGQPRSEFYELATPILNHPKLGVVSVVKIKANLNPRTNEIIEHGFHKDLPFECLTAIYYVNSNNGYTKFETGQKVQSVENRLVMFNSQTKHTGTTCSDQKSRVVINFNFFNADIVKKRESFF